MNNVSLVGRLTADPELRYTQDNRAYVRANLAVDRGLSKEDKEAGKQSADFISCVFWNTTAENLAKYMKKGSQIAITGKIQTGSYDGQDGRKIYTTDVRVNQLTFIESKAKDNRPEPEYDGKDEPQVKTTNVTEDADPFKDFGNEIVLTDEDLPF